MYAVTGLLKVNIYFMALYNGCILGCCGVIVYTLSCNQRVAGSNLSQVTVQRPRTSCSPLVCRRPLETNSLISCMRGIEGNGPAFGREIFIIINGGMPLPFPLCCHLCCVLYPFSGVCRSLVVTFVAI